MVKILDYIQWNTNFVLFDYNMKEVEVLIAKITTKVTDLKQNLASVTSDNQVLSEKIQTLQKQLSERKEELDDLQEKINVLSLQSNTVSEPGEERNSEIEAIVREIDDCISRLKK